MRGRRRSEWGFKDIVKDPGYLDRATRAQEKVDAAAQAAKNWNDEKVASLTRHFVLEAPSSREAWRDARILRELGVRTHPAVLGLLRDASLYDRLVKPTGKDILPEAPFNRACDLLGDAPPSEAVEPLAPFLKDPSEEIRKDAALAIARTGAPTISAFVRQALADLDEYVRSYALMGLGFALKRSALAANVRDELFPDVAALLKEHKNADKAPDILFQLNANAAKEFFLSPEVFTADSPILREVLETLADARVPAPRELLLELIAHLEAGEVKYPRIYALGEALRLLGQQQREEDRDFLRAT